jgi:hypothetical protein
LLEQYLEELGRELARHLPEEDVQTRLAEIDAHLRDGIEGRQELGLDAESAERETLMAFGTARKVAKSITANPARTTLRPRLMWIGTGYTVFFTFLMGGWAIVERFPASYVWFFWAIIACVIGFAVAAFRARGPAPFQLLAVAAGATISCWFAVGLSWLNLYAYAGGGVIPPGQAGRFLEENRRLLAERSADRQVFESGWNLLRSPLGIEALRTEGGYTAPVIQPVSYDRRPQYTILATAKEARKAWSDLSQRGRGLFDTVRPQSNITAILQAQADPWGNLLSQLPDVLTAGAVQGGAICVIDLTFGSLGAVAFVYRRRRGQRGTVA